MKLQDKLPRGVTVRGRFHRADFDFRNVLDMMDTLSRDDLLPEARDYLALKCVMRRPPKHTAEAIEAVRGVLFPAAKKHADKAKITDFEQDADLIRAAFLQEYGINLFKDRLHWLEFSALLSGLPEGSRYSDVLGIRARPMPATTKYNAEEWLAKAKAELMVRVSDAEAETTLNQSLRGVAESLLLLAGTNGR